MDCNYYVCWDSVHCLVEMMYFKPCFLGKIANENSVPVFRNGLKRTQSAFPEHRGLKPHFLRKGRPGKAHDFSGIHNCFLMVSSTISLVICLTISLKSLLQSRAPPGRASPLPLTLGISVSGNLMFGNIGTNIRKSWELMHV